jgi:hypothetical protein
MDYDKQYATLDELIAAMRAAELLGFVYRTRTVQLNGFTVKERKYIITVINDNAQT